MTGVVLDNIKSYGQLDNKTKQLQQKEKTSCQQCLTGYNAAARDVYLKFVMKVAKAFKFITQVLCCDNCGEHLEAL